MAFITSTRLHPAYEKDVQRVFVFVAAGTGIGFGIDIDADIDPDTGIS